MGSRTGSADSNAIFSSSTDGENVARDVEKQPTAAQKPPSMGSAPNGGLEAWLQVAGSWCLMFNCWGIVNTYGVFQTYYQTELLKNESASNIAWIGSIQAFLLLFVGALTGPLYDYGYFRHLLAVGSFLMVFGMMMVSLCTQYWQLIIAQGIVVGIGGGCLFRAECRHPADLLLDPHGVYHRRGRQWQRYWWRHLPDRFPETGGQHGLRLGHPHPRVYHASDAHPAPGRHEPSHQALRRAQTLRRIGMDRAPFYLFAIAGFFGFIGMYMPLFYVSVYAIDEKIMSPDMAFYLFPILNAGSTLGRIIPNYGADKTGPLNMFIPTLLGLAILSFSWISITSSASLIVFTAIYGFFSGTFLTLPFSTVVTLSPHVGVVGVRMGMACAVVSLGLLIGTPVGGAILSRGGWTALQAFGGAALLVSTVVMMGSRVAKVGWGLTAKA
ncbi:MFS general substrate transporter [Apiospora saccharicola]